MAKYLSLVASGKRNIPQPNDALVAIVPVDVSLPATALAVGDIITLVDLPPGVQLVDATLSALQLDSGGSPTLAFSLGEENAAGTDLATVYEAALKCGHGAGGSMARLQTAVAANAPRTATRRISLKVTTAAATPATADKVLTVYLQLRN